MICALATAAAYLILGIVPHGFGLGDTKLALVTGLVAAWYGTGAAVAAFASALLLLWVTAVVALLRRRSRRSHVPHGPFMLAGMLLAVVMAAD